jgi:hypothetical protein
MARTPEQEQGEQPAADATPSVPAEQTNPTTSAPAAPAAPAVDPAASADLAAREQSVAEKEANAQAILDKAQEVMARAEAATRAAEAITSDDTEAKLQASKEEKANVVKAQIEAAYGDQELGEPVSFTPVHTLTNVAAQHTIVFEEGVTYEIPRVLADDLKIRDDAYGNYKTHLHIREEKFINAGTISAGGK